MREEAFTITPGTKVHLGQPKSPDVRLAIVIAERIAGIAEVREAHFPQAFVEGSMPTATQVLVIAIADRSDIPESIRRVREQLAAVLPSGRFVDVWPVQVSDPLLEDVRRSDCCIFRRTQWGEGQIERPWSLWRRVRRALQRPR
jgi:hypothetical protein